MKMIPLHRGGFPLAALAFALGAGFVASPQARGQGVGLTIPVPLPDKKVKKTNDARVVPTVVPAGGTLGYGGPGLYPGYQGFGLGYHLGYGYGGTPLSSVNALGTGAEGGYPGYGGPGYPHQAPTLRRIGGESPFCYFGGPGYPTADNPNFYGGVGALVPDQPVVTIEGEGFGPPSADYGAYTGLIPYPESTFAPSMTRPPASEAPPAPNTPAQPAPPAVNPAPGSSSTRSFGIDVEPVVVAGGAKRLKITRLYPGGAAGSAGLKVGDVIMSIDGYITDQPGNLTWIISKAAPGKPFSVKLAPVNDGQPRMVALQLP